MYKLPYYIRNKPDIYYIHFNEHDLTWYYGKR